MADPPEEGSGFVTKVGCQPINCLKVGVPFEDSELTKAKTFINQGRKHNCCTFWQDSMDIDWVQEWQRPDSVPKVIFEKVSTNIHFLCWHTLPRRFIAEED